VDIFGKEEPEAVEVAGQPLRCLICRNASFYRRSAQLHGRVATFFNLEWTSPTCTCVICSECGYVHWFAS
jgi:predicted nucleic-acid-binding Zn-ribbon protein